MQQIFNINFCLALILTCKGHHPGAISTLFRKPIPKLENGHSKSISKICPIYNIKLYPDEKRKIIFHFILSLGGRYLYLFLYLISMQNFSFLGLIVSMLTRGWKLDQTYIQTWRNYNGSIFIILGAMGYYRLSQKYSQVYLCSFQLIHTHILLKAEALLTINALQICTEPSMRHSDPMF